MYIVNNAANDGMEVFLGIDLHACFQATEYKGKNLPVVIYAVRDGPSYEEKDQQALSHLFPQSQRLTCMNLELWKHDGVTK